jgi:hypothetical protein
VNLLGVNIDTLKQHTETLITDASKEVGLEEDEEKTNYMLMSCHQNPGQHHNKEIANRCFENMAQLKIWERQKQRKKFDSGKNLENTEFWYNVCYHSVVNRLSSCLLSKNVRIGMCKSIILPVILHGCRSWSLNYGRNILVDWGCLRARC